MLLIVFAATAAAGAEPVAASDAVSARFVRSDGIAEFPVTSLAALGNPATFADVDRALADALPAFLDKLRASD